MSHVDMITLKAYYDSFTDTIEERSEARERFVNLKHSKDLCIHEARYIKDAFTYIPPADEPDLSLSEYLYQLANDYFNYTLDVAHLIPKQ